MAPQRQKGWRQDHASTQDREDQAAGGSWHGLGASLPRTDFGTHVGRADHVRGAARAGLLGVARHDRGLCDRSDVTIDVDGEVHLDDVAQADRVDSVPERRHMACQVVHRHAGREGDPLFNLALIVDLSGLHPRPPGPRRLLNRSSLVSTSGRDVWC